MITGIDVQNFGCFDSSAHSMTLGPETVIIGPNNAGKSTMLAAYALVARKGFDPPLTKFSSIDEASFGNNPDSEISITVHGDDSLGKATRQITVKKFNAITVNDSGPQQAVAALERALQGTWYLHSERAFVARSRPVGGAVGPLDYLGNNTIQFLLERFTSRDERWSVAEEWLKRIDPDASILKSPLRGNQASVETTRKYSEAEFDINVALQGSGVQRALQIIAAAVFSPKGSVIIIEEPEMNLHKDAQQVLVDLFNKAVNEWDKQIVFSTHSWNMVLPLMSDAGVDGTSPRGQTHTRISPSKLKVAVFSQATGRIRIEDYNLSGKTFRQVQDDLRLVWG